MAALLGPNSSNSSSNSSSSHFTATMRSRLDQLSEYISTENNQPSLSLEVLLDGFLAIHTDCKAAQQNDQISGFLSKYDKLVSKLQSLRVNTRDFDTIKTLATGAVGKVCLVRAKKDSKVYAMKILKKQDLLTRQEAAFFMEERNALVFSQNSRWITTLYAAFQDDENLYLVMEYVSGGSLRAMINNRETPMTEAEARFYIAEMIVALEVIHKYNYIHRDIKPENWLIDSTGHVKLADFGSCIRISETARVTSHETVGTPDYISPEILRAHEGSANYGQSVDWWSLGIILYELLFDEVPFYSESLVETYGKIMDHERYFAFPEDADITPACRDLIQKLICNQDVRLGKNGIEELKSHPWFEGVDWDNIAESKAPFVPELSGPEDTRYFEDEENESKKVAKKPYSKSREFSGKSLAFVGYTYVQNATAAIVWPGFSADGPQAAVPPPSATAPSAAPNARSSVATMSGTDRVRTMQALEEQLQAEIQKASALAATKKQLEEETISLKAALGRETTQRTDLQAAITAVEKDKIRLEAEYKQLKLVFDRDAHERQSLEEKLVQLKSSADRETQSKAETQELAEIRKRLERDVAALNASLRDEKALAMKREVALAEATNAKTKLEAEMDKLSKALSEEKRLKQEALSKAEDLGSRADGEVARAAESVTRLAELQAEVARQTSEAAALKAGLQQEQEKSAQLDQLVADLEQAKAVLQIEIESVQAKLADALSESREMSQTVTDLQNSQRETVDKEIENLRVQLSSQTASRNKLMDEASQLAKTKALLEMERGQLRAQLAAEAKAHAETKLAVERALQSLFEKSQRMAALDESRRKLEAQAEAADIKASRLSAQLDEAAHHMQTLEQTITSLRQTSAETQSELHDVRVKYDHETLLTASLKAKIAELEATSSEELKSRITFESLSSSLQQMNAQLVQETERLRQRIDVITKEHENSITEHHGVVALIKAEHKAVEERLTAEKEQRFKLEDLHGSLTRRVHELEEAVRLEMDARLRAELALEEPVHRVQDLTTELQASQLREHKLQDRVNELDQHTEALKYKLEVYEDREREREREAQMAADSKMRPDDRSHSRFKLRGIFFKGSRESVDTSERVTQRLQESEEDIRSKDSTDHRRKHSSQSMDSLASSLRLQPMSPTIKTAEASMFDLFVPGDVLQGWLKVPKGGKVKKGWRMQYAVVREFKMLLFDNERDVDSQPGVTVFDITADIFLAKTVSQNEVIHASSKDVDAIFKVQTYSASTAASSPGSAEETQQRIQKLQTDIDLEIRMQQGTEKLLSVTTDAQKITVISQLDASNKRLRALRQELEKLTPASPRNMYDGSDSRASSKESVENSSMHSETAARAEEIQNLHKQLEAQLEDETKKREVLSKLSASDSRKKHKDGSAKDVEIELLTTDRTIAKIKENLDVFSSGDKDKIDALVQRLRKLNKTSDNMGHFFAPRQFYKPTDCFVCHEPFYDSKNQGMECSGCKMVCHKNCKVETGCQDLIRLKSVAPMYFLTKDIQDRAKWLQGLKYQRMEFERTLRNETGPSSASEKRISSFVESPNSKRVSGIMQGIMTPRRITLMDHSPKS